MTSTCCRKWWALKVFMRCDRRNRSIWRSDLRQTSLSARITSFVMPRPSTANMIAFVREAAKTSRRTASFCNGAFVLAEAGLLDGRRATTHWLQASRFRARFPKVRMEEDRIFVIDGPIWTSAGMTAGFDLVLAMVDSDMGPQAAQEVARLLVLSQRRIGGQKQLTALLDLTPKSDRIERVLTHIRLNLRDALSIDELAAVASLSPRQFSRAFWRKPVSRQSKAVEQLRLEAARFMMEEGRHSVNEVARDAGFGDRERMRRAFLRTFGVSAEALRRKSQRRKRRLPIKQSRVVIPAKAGIQGLHDVRFNVSAARRATAPGSPRSRG